MVVKCKRLPCRTSQQIAIKKYYRYFCMSRSVSAIFLNSSGAFDNAWWSMILPKTKRGGCPRNIYSILAGYFVDRRVRCSWRIRSYGVEDSSDGFPAGIGAGIHALELRLSLPWGGAYADDVTILVRYIFPGDGRALASTVLQLIGV